MFSRPPGLYIFIAGSVFFFHFVTFFALTSPAYSAEQTQTSGQKAEKNEATDDAVTPDTSYKIGTITILPDNIFDLTDPVENSFIGRTANELHIVTTETTIRNELLFKEGDSYYKDIIEETERNLRARSFLTDVEVTTKANKETKTVDVTVKTRDQWTLLVGGTAGGTNENKMVGADLGEKNLLGLGQAVTYSYRHENAGSTSSASFSDPNLMGSRYAFNVSYQQTPLELDRGLSFQKPFYSLGTEFSYGFIYNTIGHSDPINNFTNYRLTSFYGVGSAIGRVILRPELILSLGEQTVYNWPTPAISTRDNKLELQISLLDQPRRFVKDTYIQKYHQVEDIYLGANYVYLIGQGFVMLGSTNSEITMSFQASKWTKFFERDYLYGTFTLAENDDNFNKQVVASQFQYYYRHLSGSTLFFNVQFTYRDSDANRFFLGGTTGLRGYKANEFTGRDIWLMNVEDRIFTYKPILYGLLEPGFVIFFDSGDAWNSYGYDQFHSLHNSFGVGLRLALLKAPGISLLQIDYGIPLDENAAPVLTVGMSGSF